MHAAFTSYYFELHVVCHAAAIDTLLLCVRTEPAKKKAKQVHLALLCPVENLGCKVSLEFLKRCMVSSNTLALKS
jgi:hypothetical protein